MSSASIKRVKTVKYSNMLDRLVSVAEYSIYTDGYSKFANLLIYNSSDRTVHSFEMRLDIYDDNKTKIKTKTISINNLSLRPRLFLKLNVKVSLPMEAIGFNYHTISINSGNSSLNNNPNSQPIKSSYAPIKTREDQILIKQSDVQETLKENVTRKTYLKTKWLFLLPVIAISSIALTSIYFNNKLGTLTSSTTREVGDGKLSIAEKNDFNYTIDNNSITLKKYVSNSRRKLYFDPSVFIPNYTGQTIIIAEDCFRSTKIERLIIEGPCSIGSASFAYASNLEYFACVNYTFKNNDYLGDLISLSTNCFFGCTSLTTFKYQVSSFNAIPAGSFYNCDKLSNFVLPPVARIDRQAFYNCTSLSDEIILPATIEKIGIQSFDGSSIRKVTFNNPLTIKEENSFPSGSKFFGSNIYDENGREIQQ